jgi:murein DD-endopeptidase MepM/ murein hydrolase activator NlpD
MRHRFWFVLTFVFIGTSVFFGSLDMKSRRLLKEEKGRNTTLQRRMDGLLSQVQRETYNIGMFTHGEASPGNLMPPMPEELQGKLREYRQQQLFVPDWIPVARPYAVSQKYSDKHPAWDFAAPLDSKVMAAATGLVEAVYVDPYFGNVLTIDHLNGTVTFYAHLDEVFFRVGDLVKKGEPVGLVGNTGNSSSAHLHFEVRQRGRSVDPAEFVIPDPDSAKP